MLKNDANPSPDARIPLPMPLKDPIHASPSASNPM